MEPVNAQLFVAMVTLKYIVVATNAALTELVYSIEKLWKRLKNCLHKTCLELQY
jgi:hypothetical protein